MKTDKSLHKRRILFRKKVETKKDSRVGNQF
ncbi:hypothetical protein O205_01660 [Bacillus amyloliquefaciens EGD-AQ14]|nr:hypothetical protein O205_01660 [Bacillus amyloliquefaciens EGD-AQ14]